ncbi:MAG TPA: hypothetical protein VN641_20045 [Urbifossiella sp.]|jgi:hypothetical protein|nr:hypothetical protein [Urbifossiella sp.]
MNRVEVTADLTPPQRKYLRNVAEYCRTSPTLLIVYRKMMPFYLFLLSFSGLIVYVCLANEAYTKAWALGGFIAGVLLRDFANIYQRLLLWPAIEAIVDRERLAELTHEPTAGQNGFNS